MKLQSIFVLEWIFLLGTENRTYLIIAVVNFLVFGGNSFVFANEEEQLWQTTGVSFDVNKDWAVVVEEQLKFDNEPKHFFYHHTDLGFVYKSVANGIDLGFNYRSSVETMMITGAWKTGRT